MEAAFNDQYLRKKFIDLVKKHNCTTFYETGSWHGLSAKIASVHIKVVKTVENNPTFYRIAKSVLKECKNVHVFEGSSPKVLRETLKKNEKGLIFFLDAHWNTLYQKADNWPLLDELEVIAEKRIKPVIIIHDFFVPNEKGRAKFNFDTYNGQPLNLEYVRPSLDKIYGKNGWSYSYNERVQLNSGIVYIEPN